MSTHLFESKPWPGSSPRLYRSPLIDNRRWDAFEPRPGDVVINSSQKAGTTWMQNIIARLVFGPRELPAPLNELSPWLESPVHPAGEIGAALEAQDHRRFIKAHLPPDGTPFWPEVRYIVLCRDGRDVFVSLTNHVQRLRRDLMTMMNERARADPATNGEMFPIRENWDIHELFDLWISKSCFPWEGDGFPQWSHFGHLAGWWPLVDLGNVMFVHFSDLLDDLDAAMRRVASFVDIEIDEGRWSELVERCTFEDMKANADTTVPAGAGFVGGGAGFLHSGTNGRWKSLLTSDELDRYHERVSEVLNEEQQAWMESGGWV